MSSVRLILAWLLMAAIPLQGLAAASMLYCGMGSHHGTETVLMTVYSPTSAQSGATEQHDDSQHGHGAAGEGKKIADDLKQKLPDAAHKCGVCASCCHGLAITEFPQTVVFAPLPQAELAELFVLIHTRPTLVADRPPRA